MAVTAQIDQFHSTARTRDNGPGLFSRLLTRVVLMSEARAIHRLETEAAHLLSPEQLRQIKIDYAVRKAKALSKAG